MLAEKSIRKHVAIIHAHSLMSILQRKVVNVLLYEAINNKNHSTNRHSVSVECKMPFAKLCKAIKFKSNNTQYLKESIDELASLKIEWNLLKDKAPIDVSFLNLRILHGSPTFYHDNTLHFSFHRVMLNLLDNPTIYGTLDIDLQSDFESKYGHALYENSTRFINLQKNKIIQLDTFRKMLGVQEDKYTNMRELTRNVIRPSIEEVNDRANFVVSLDPIKAGRKVTGFEVSVKNKKKTIIIHDEQVENKNTKIASDIKDTFGKFNESILNNIISNYPEEYIHEKISYTKKYAKKSKTGFYPIPYFISAIKYDYKFKDEESQPIQHSTPHSNESEWQNKLSLLESDLAHWERLLVFAEQSSNNVQIKNIKNIISTCQGKISQHHLDSVTQEEAT